MRESHGYSGGEIRLERFFAGLSIWWGLSW